MSAADQSAPAASSPSKLKPLIPFAAALVLGLAVGGASGAFVVGPAMAKGIVPNGPPATAAAEAEKAAESESASSGEKGEKGKEAPGNQIYTLDNLVLNPAESGGTRFLLLSVAFETPDAALVESMKTRDAELRDVVIVALGSKTVEQLADMRGRDAIKGELQTAALTLFKKKSPMRVYFPQFVIQ